MTPLKLYGTKVTPSFVDLWDQGADSWNDFVESGKDDYKELIIAPATLGLIPPASSTDQKALDLCCGEGYYSRKLKALGYDTYGVDISKEMIDLARRKGEGITYFHSDASTLPMFADESLALTLCGMALMDTPNWDEVIREVYRTTAAGGLFVFSITHPCFSFEKAGGWHTDESGNKRFFKMDGYFVEDEATFEWDMPGLAYPFRTKIYHRTLSSYHDAVVSSGFVVEKLVEPHPAIEERGRRIAGSERIAYFLIFKCRKGA